MSIATSVTPSIVETDVKLPINRFPPGIKEDEHQELLSFLLGRLDAGQMTRETILKRYASIDKTVSTWQILSDSDSQRKVKQDNTGQAQAIHINLPLVHTHMDDMVSFFAGVYSPAAGDFFQQTEKETQDSGKELVKKLNTDAKISKYYKGLCETLRSLLKYNVGGFALTWAAKNLADPAPDQGGFNNVESIDMYNVLWDPLIKDPANVRNEAEWAARIWNKNRMWLTKREKSGMFFGVGNVLPTNGYLTNGNVATYYKNPPNQAGLSSTDDLSSSGKSDANWKAYGANLAMDKETEINGHEVVEMYIWMNPNQFSIDMAELPDAADDYYLFRFMILDSKQIISCSVVQSEEALDAKVPTEIPYYLGFLNQDDMGTEQRSIAELLQPFQSFGSFLMNAHIAGARASIYGIQGYDPTMFDMGAVNPGDTAVRLPSKTPGRDVRSGLISLNGTIDTRQTMDDLSRLFSVMKEFFPSQALPSQIAGMDRAVTSQVSAVLQGVNRRLHMAVRILDDDILGPLRMGQYTNLVRNKADIGTGLNDDTVQRILGNGLAQLNREAAATAMQQLLFALIQNPEASAEYDTVGLMNFWSSLMNLNTDLTQFKKQQPAAPGAEGGPPAQAAAPTIPGM